MVVYYSMLPLKGANNNITAQLQIAALPPLTGIKPRFSINNYRNTP